jgi:hypothetical protein
MYSTRQQDEERLAELFSSLSDESIGIKWRPIQTAASSGRVKDRQEEEDCIYAIHLECSSDRAQEAQTKLSQWYGSGACIFPDGTKMCLVHRSKYAMLIARQAALSSKIGISTTWELSTNVFWISCTLTKVSH